MTQLAAMAVIYGSRNSGTQVTWHTSFIHGPSRSHSKACCYCDTIACTSN